MGKASCVFKTLEHAIEYFAPQILSKFLPAASKLQPLVIDAVKQSTDKGGTDLARARAIVADGIASANVILAGQDKPTIDPLIVDTALTDAMSLIGDVSALAHAHPANVKA